MLTMLDKRKYIVGVDDLVLVTGASGFIGSRVVNCLLERGFRSIRCLVRPSSRLTNKQSGLRAHPGGTGVEVVEGNLLSPEDCAIATKDVSVVFHLAAARGEKSFPDAFVNSVVTTRNLLEACRRQPSLRRFVNVSSFAVYTNRGTRGALLDESCPVEDQPHRRGDAYTFSKVKQEEIVLEYGRTFGLPYVVLRPGYVYGPGNPGLSGRVGIDTFGIYLHLGGSNPIPLTYVDNCAEAIVLAGLVPDINGEIFNIVDDDLVSSRQFLREYKRNVKSFRSVYCPHFVSYGFCWLWEKYSAWSQGQLPPAFNRRRWHAEWKKTRYSNQKLKERLGWIPRVPTSEGLMRHLQSCREETKSA
jgi:nucleoside-diphosphate-sugar epimerase